MGVSWKSAEIWLAAAAIALGAVAAVSQLGRGLWLDEFWTLVSAQPGMSAQHFLETMSRDVHPILHYGLVWVAQNAGLTDIGALRALNGLGVALVLWAAWYAWRAQALTKRQAGLLLALYASSPFFWDNFAELRAYFLMYSAAIAAGLVWRVLIKGAWREETWRPGDLAAWFAVLAVLVNLHHFALLLGGVLTLSLIAVRRGRGCMRFAAVSLAAALPALWMLFLQVQRMDAGIVGWVQTGRIDALFKLGDAAWAGAGYNLVALGCAILLLLRAAESKEGWRAYRDELVALAAIVAYAGLLILANAVRPIVVDRYLAAGAGAFVVAVACLAGAAAAPRWTLAAACVFALIVEARALRADAPTHTPWSVSAAYVAQAVRQCPQTRVYIDPEGDVRDIAMYTAARRYGLTYYAERFSIPVQEIPPRAEIAGANGCDALIWAENMQLADGATAEETLARLGLRTRTHAEVVRVGSGVVIRID